MTGVDLCIDVLGWRLSALGEIMAPNVRGESGRLHWYLTMDRCDRIMGIPLEDIPLVLADAHGVKTPYWWDTCGEILAKRLEIMI